MKYYVKRNWYNCYRCCCFQTSVADPIFITEKEKAIQYLSIDKIPPEYGDFGLYDVYIYEVNDDFEIDDESDDIDVKLIGWAERGWKSGSSRGDKYNNTEWYGSLEGNKFRIETNGIPKGRVF